MTASDCTEAHRLLDQLLTEKYTLATLTRNVFGIVDAISKNSHDKDCDSFLESIVALTQVDTAIHEPDMASKKRKIMSATQSALHSSSSSSSSSSSAFTSLYPSLEQKTKRPSVAIPKVDAEVGVKEKIHTRMLRLGTAVAAERKDGRISISYYDKSQSLGGDRPLSSEQIKGLQATSILLCESLDDVYPYVYTFDKAIHVQNPVTIDRGSQWIVKLPNECPDAFRVFVTFSDPRNLPVFFDIEVERLIGGYTKTIDLPTITVEVDDKTGHQRVETGQWSRYTHGFRREPFKKLSMQNKYNKIISIVRKLTK